MEPDAAEALVHWIDESLVVVDKPAGLLALPDGYDPAKPHLRAVLEPALGRLWIVHRLDKDTSGLIVLARDAEAHRDLNTQFERGEVEKTYLAIVEGVPAWETIELTWPLRADGDRRHRTVVDPRRGKAAVTICTRLQVGRGRALLEIKPKTGRTHQNRAHLGPPPATPSSATGSTTDPGRIPTHPAWRCTPPGWRSAIPGRARDSILRFRFRRTWPASSPPRGDPALASPPAARRSSRIAAARSPRGARSPACRAFVPGASNRSHRRCRPGG